MAFEISKLAKEDIPYSVEIVQKAFEDDPYFLWVFDAQKDAQNAVQSEIWNDSRGYYFCNVIAVADDARGKGIGKKLVEIVTDQADQEGMKCYLESSKKVPNLEIYGRMGFKFAKEMECHDGEDVCKVSGFLGLRHERIFHFRTLASMSF
ncbi:acetyltransferase [Histoplasma capsulatum]|uniref:Acetyltransferase n=1 Tax=Ajellomyces capsulatus TaxID=5037 RepID=A0A8A1M0Z1_AJECA|nr:acetyltransferase [Histoplasma capsulatum]